MNLLPTSSPVSHNFPSSSSLSLLSIPADNSGIKEINHSADKSNIDHETPTLSNIHQPFPNLNIVSMRHNILYNEMNNNSNEQNHAAKLARSRKYHVDQMKHNQSVETEIVNTNN